MNQYNKERVDSFFSAIEPWKEAYTNVGLSFFALRRGEQIYLLQARLFLNATLSSIPPLRVDTPSIVAGHLALSERELDARQFIDAITNDGTVNTPFGKVIFPKPEYGDIAAYFDPFHQEGVAAGNRLPVLSISGEYKHKFIDAWKLDWELKAQPQPFDSVDELLALIVLGGKRSDSALIEIVANTVAFINQNSSVSGTDARPRITLAKKLDKSKSRIGYRVFMHGKVVNRGSIDGSSLTWTGEDDFNLGEGWVGVPDGAVLHCVASYNDHAQHQWWVADPAHSQNARRVSIEASDGKLDVLQDYLFRDYLAEEKGSRKKLARDFEYGVAWLMWMLGFNVAQAGATERTSDAPDILATSPQGNILVVECTVSILKAENKLANLVSRAEVVRTRLIASGNGHLKLLPVIVTARTREEVKGELEQARQSGVAVVTQEDLRDLLQQTIATPNAEAIYTRGWESIQPPPDFGAP